MVASTLYFYNFNKAIKDKSVINQLEGIPDYLLLNLLPKAAWGIFDCDIHLLPM